VSCTDCATDNDSGLGATRVAADLALTSTSPAGVHLLEDDAQLAATGSSGRLLSPRPPRLEAQRVFLRGPLILVDPAASPQVSWLIVPTPWSAIRGGWASGRPLCHSPRWPTSASHRGRTLLLALRPRLRQR